MQQSFLVQQIGGHCSHGCTHAQSRESCAPHTQEVGISPTRCSGGSRPWPLSEQTVHLSGQPWARQGSRREHNPGMEGGSWPAEWPQRWFRTYVDNRIVAADRICTPSNLSLPLLLMTMSLPFLFFSKHTQAHAHTRTHTHSVLSEVCSFLNYFQDSFRHVRSFLNNLSFILCLFGQEAPSVC